MARIVLYHGTARDVEGFDRHYALRGSEPNSALGIHLTDCPDNAAFYAELAARDAHAGKPRVLVVEAELSKVGIVRDAADYLGRDPDFFDVETNRTREEFVGRRLELQDQGFDAVATEETELEEVSNCWAVFDPEKLRVVGEMTLAEVDAMDWISRDYTGIEFIGVRLFDPSLDEAPEP